MRIGWTRVVAASLACMVSVVSHAERFAFVALGDTAYNLPDDYAKYDALIQTINTARPAFSIHVGDIWGATECTDVEYTKVFAQFSKFAQPVAYTPGDNEWLDCMKPEFEAAYLHREKGTATPEQLALLKRLRDMDLGFSGSFRIDSLERLQAIRRIFFSKPETLGMTPMPTIRQSDVSTYKDSPENMRWIHKGVVFATVNVPGAYNGFYANDEARTVESMGRTRANIDWIRSAFETAMTNKAPAVVIAMHAAIFDEGPPGAEFGQPVLGGYSGAYYWIAKAIRDFGGAFAKPVLLINGDDHNFLVDKPFRLGNSEKEPPKFDNITRVQVFGAPDLRAVRVSVDTETPWVFGFEPLYSK